MEPIDILKGLDRPAERQPMGRSVAGPEFLEGRMTEYLVSFFADFGSLISGSKLCRAGATSSPGSTGREARGHCFSMPTRIRSPSTG